jgi:small subunit ribosomal protein S7
MKSLKGMAGGGQALQIPVPLALQRRRRTAVMWILDVCEKKVAPGSGKDMFARKFASEIISIVEGKSGVWTKRESVHKLAIAARSNLTKVSAIQARK